MKYPNAFEKWYGPDKGKLEPLYKNCSKEGWEAESFMHTRSCKDCAQLQVKGDSKWCTHTIYKNDSLDGFHCCLWEAAK